MRGQPPIAGPRPPSPESYFRLLLNLGSIVVAVLVLAVVIQRGPRPTAPAVIKPAASAAPQPLIVAPTPPRPEAPPAPPAEELDPGAVRKAEAALRELGR